MESSSTTTTKHDTNTGRRLTLKDYQVREQKYNQGLDLLCKAIDVHEDEVDLASATDEINQSPRSEPMYLEALRLLREAQHKNPTAVSELLAGIYQIVLGGGG
jgi:hypothetical protein